MLNQIKSMFPSDLEQPALHHLLLSAVAPRPICFASTIDVKGNVNLSPFSFFNVFSSNPPIMIFSPAKGRNGHKNTLDNVKEIGEVVINIVNYPIVEQMSLSSTAYPKGVNEFIKSGLTQIKSDLIRPPRVGESPVALECTVEKIIELGDDTGAGNLVIAKVVKIHVQEKYLNESGQLDTKALDLVARMGGNWYSRVTGDSLFEIPKPLRAIGMGIDALPIYIRESTLLSGNNLARLGALDNLPSASDIKGVKDNPQVQVLLSNSKLSSIDLTKKLFKLAKSWIERQNANEALCLLMLIHFEYKSN
ncbi:MAG: flavin reductase family protein [Saprospiraceae bacterium]|nr:flavin reductase family protein [Saprospiraceae bacterium]